MSSRKEAIEKRKINRIGLEQQRISKLISLVQDLGNKLSLNFPRYKFLTSTRHLTITINIPNGNIIIEMQPKKISSYEGKKEEIECIVYRTPEILKRKTFRRDLINNYETLRNEILSFLIDYFKRLKLDSPYLLQDN